MKSILTTLDNVFLTVFEVFAKAIERVAGINSYDLAKGALVIAGCAPIAHGLLAGFLNLVEHSENPLNYDPVPLIIKVIVDVLALAYTMKLFRQTLRREGIFFAAKAVCKECQNQRFTPDSSRHTMLLLHLLLIGAYWVFEPLRVHNQQMMMFASFYWIQCLMAQRPILGKSNLYERLEKIRRTSAVAVLFCLAGVGYLWYQGYRMTFVEFVSVGAIAILTFSLLTKRWELGMAYNDAKKDRQRRHH